MKIFTSLVLFISLWLFSFECLAAKGVYQTPKAFISASLGENSAVKMLWLTKEDKAVIAEILSHKFNRMRIRYWQQGNDSVWILDEVGKEKPITIGVHISVHQGKQHISKLKVLTFRESRGDEVRHDFYAKQFINASLDSEKRLTQDIDGITGATLSVRATTKIARLALWLNNKALNGH
ncbi:MAG: FMN-binding protein [Colwellia sp.]|nr:FMN-binding protein [Colwellia sp.]MCW8864739.1 FMN-binding protein [Colwellia sp.]MCW9081890.1 FMN-binding protein [Colwellia sp.]